MKKFLIVFIFLFAFFLRVYKLGSYPVGLLWDEASLGYNAYSILQTGKDEYGHILPLIFKSFGDYKPGLYVYLTIPSVLIFGLTEFSVRFPSALFGSLSVVVFYFLVRGMTLNPSTSLRTSSERIYAETFPLIAAFLLAISPWHIMFSRGAWELNVMLFEFLCSFCFLAKYLSKEKLIYLIISIIFIFSTLFTYQSAKFLFPLLISGFLYFYRGNIDKAMRKNIKLFILAGGLLFLGFNIWTVVTGKGGRVKAMSVFSYPRSSQETEMFLKQDNNSKIYFNLFHGSPVFFIRSVAGRYFHHFSGKFLFTSGDWSNQRNGVIYQGVMYYLDVLFLVIGLAFIFAKRRNPLDNFMLFWLIISPLPAALTRDDISSVRSFTMVIPLVYIVAIGTKEIFSFFCRFRPSIKFLFYILYFIFYILLLVRFLDLYFVHDPKFTSKNRLYGYRESIETIKPLVSKKNKVIFTDKYGQPYIFYLFYTKYDPFKYQQQAILKENPFGDVGKVEKVDNLEFREIYWPNDRKFSNSLFVGDEFDLPQTDIVGQENIVMLKETKFLDNNTAFRIVETR